MKGLSSEVIASSCLLLLSALSLPCWAKSISVKGEFYCNLICDCLTVSVVMHWCRWLGFVQGGWWCHCQVAGYHVQHGARLLQLGCVCVLQEAERLFRVSRVDTDDGYFTEPVCWSDSLSSTFFNIEEGGFGCQFRTPAASSSAGCSCISF